MLSMFIVLAVIVGTLNVANFVSVTSSADKLLGMLVENGGQFPDVGILLYQVEEPLHIDIGFLLGCNYAPQLGQWASSVICSFS